MTKPIDEEYKFPISLNYLEVQDVIHYFFETMLDFRRKLLSVEAQRDSYRDKLLALGIDMEDDPDWWRKFEDLKTTISKNK